MTSVSPQPHERGRAQNQRAWLAVFFSLIIVAAVAILLTAQDQRKAVGDVILSTVGISIVGIVVAVVRQSRKLRALKAQFPDQPWLWRSDWAAGVIESGNRAALMVAGGLAIFWNAISLPACVVLLPRELAKGKYGVLAFTLPFLLIGLALAIYAAYLFWRWKRFGTSNFHLTQVPGIIGGQLQGELHIPVRLPSASVIQLRLDCVHRLIIGAGKNSRVKEETLWSTRQAGEPVPASLHRTVVPLVFVIPPGLRTTWASDDRREQIVWRLHATANLPGVDYAADFEVPVFELA